MKTEEKAKKVQNIATALAAIFGAVGAFFGIFQAQVSADLKNQVTSLQNASQQTIVNVISTLGDDAQAADLAQSGDTVAITEQLINVYNSTKDQNAALTSETQTLRSENAALQEQVEFAARTPSAGNTTGGLLTNSRSPALPRSNIATKARPPHLMCGATGVSL